MIARGRPTWLLSSLAFAACLPLGEPPSGRQLLATRDLEDVGFIEPAPGQRASIVTYRFAPVYDPKVCASFGAYSAIDDTSGASGLVSERPLADQVERPGPTDPDYVNAYGPYYAGGGASPYAVRTDARGRFFVAWQPPTPAIDRGDHFECPPGRGRLARIDPATGARAELGSIYALWGPLRGALSPDRARAVFTGVGPDAEPRPEIVVRDVDDREIRFPGMSPTFIGDDLYALDEARALVKLDASGVPRVLVPNVAQFYVARSARGPAVLLQTGDMFGQGPWVIFDPATETVVTMPETSSPQDAPSLSPSGRFVMRTSFENQTNETSEMRLHLFDRDAGTTESRSISNVHFYGYSGWRPGKDEYWMDEGDGTGKLTRWIAGGAIVTLDVGRGFGHFSEDGRYWFRTSLTGLNMEARDPDDPATPGYVVNPPGTTASLSPLTLSDGRLLVQAGATSRLYDIFVVDPVARTSRPIARGGVVVALGRTRVLALLKAVSAGNSGELSLVDLETGATTLIAENAYRQAVEPPAAGGDPLGPGLRLLTLVRNRFASPYDGLWLSTLP